MDDKTKQISINGKDYTLFRIPSLKGMHLEIKFLKMAIPALVAVNGIQGVFGKLPKKEDGSLDFSNIGKIDIGAILGSIDMATVSEALGAMLSALPEHELDSLVAGVMRSVMTFVPGKGSCTLVSPDLIDLAFDDTLDMYRVMFEVARFNKWRPFALLSSGPATEATAG